MNIRYHLEKAAFRKKLEDCRVSIVSVVVAFHM